MLSVDVVQMLFGLELLQWYCCNGTRRRQEMSSPGLQEILLGRHRHFSAATACIW